MNETCHNGSAHVGFHLDNGVALPGLTLLSRLNPFNLTAYGLHACVHTLKVGDYPSSSNDSLPGGWLPYRGGIRTRSKIRLARPHCPKSVHDPAKIIQNGMK
jgi:hypothetical protein